MNDSILTLFIYSAAPVDANGDAMEEDDVTMEITPSR